MRCDGKVKMYHNDDDDQKSLNTIELKDHFTYHLC